MAGDNDPVAVETARANLAANGLGGRIEAVEAGGLGASALAGRFEPGAAGLAGLVEPVPFLQELSEFGVRAAVFVGVT